MSWFVSRWWVRGFRLPFSTRGLFNMAPRFQYAEVRLLVCGYSPGCSKIVLAGHDQHAQIIEITFCCNLDFYTLSYIPIVLTNIIVFISILPPNKSFKLTFSFPKICFLVCFRRLHCIRMCLTVIVASIAHCTSHIPVGLGIRHCPLGIRGWVTYDPLADGWILLHLVW